ncbi:saccharopine dehydrogenase, partial [bacterium CPR1]|nr:saccharopine dehydrogenase [bacterium CPR1]
MSKILILGGCGAMGTEATRDLARTSDFSEIRVADIDRDKASKLCQELGGGKLSALSVDVSDENALVKLFEDVDIVLNCTSYRFGLEITRAA